ncbi:hypothetical protein HY311_04035 [Candidatus Nomurabacteria bacterium]|nr:hypothetical protein [Candidatus Nomurabacteria bacterium]
MKEASNQKTPEQIKFEAQMREEMERDMKREIIFGKAEYAAPDRQAPKEVLNEEDMSVEDLDKEIDDLKSVAGSFHRLLDKTQTPVELHITKDTKLSDLRDSKEFSMSLAIALEILEQYKISEDITINDAIAKINEKVTKSIQMKIHKGGLTG